MANEKRLLEYDAVYRYAFRGVHGGGLEDEDFDAIINAIDAVPTVDAVEVVLIKEAKQNILETLDTLMATDAELANYDYDGKNSYYRGKANAFEIARRLVNAALTNLCDNDGARMDGGNEHG